MEIAWGEEKLVPWIVRPFSFPMEYNLALFSSIHSSPPPPPLRILISFSFRVIGSFARIFLLFNYDAFADRAIASIINL